MTTATPNVATMALFSAVEALRHPSNALEAFKAANDILDAVRKGGVPTKPLVEAGLLQAAVAALKQKGQPRLFYMTLCSILARFMDDGVECADEILEMGVLENIIGLMDSSPVHEDLLIGTVELLQHCCTGINKAASIDCATSIIAKTVQAMEMLKDSAVLFEAGYRVLNRALNAINFALQDKELVQQCMDCISYGLSKHSSSKKKFEIGRKLLTCLATVPNLVLKLKQLRDSSSTPILACCAAAEIAYGIEVSEQVEPLVNIGLIEAVVAATTQDGQDAAFYKFLCAILGKCIAIHEDEHSTLRRIEQALKKSGVQGLVRVMNHFPTDESVHELVLALFSMEKSIVAENAPIMIESSVKAMEGHPHLASIFVSACNVIYYALKTPGFSFEDETLSARIVKCISDSLPEHWTHDDVDYMARSVLDILVGPERSKEMMSTLSMPYLVSQLDALRDPQTSMTAFMAAKNIASCLVHYEVPEPLVDARLFEVVINTMKQLGHGSEFYLVLSRILFLSLRPGNGEKNASRIVEKGGLEAVIRGLMQPDYTEERLQRVAVDLFSFFADEKRPGIASTILAYTVKAIEKYQDSTGLFKSGCDAFYYAMESIGWCSVEDDELFLRMVECVWNGITKHPYDDGAQKRGRKLLRLLVGVETAMEMIAHSEYRHCADADCSAAA